MVCLADIACSRIIFAVRRVVTQWFHINFVAFVHHDNVIVTARCLYPNFPKSVFARIGTVFAT